MSTVREAATEIETIEREIASGHKFEIDQLVARLQPLSIGLKQQIPVLFEKTRLFRCRVLDKPPTEIDQIGQPPADTANLGRLNEAGQSVLYLADSPHTAFAETAFPEGYCCLSEWSVTAEKLGLANGGLGNEILAARYTIPINPNADVEISADDTRVVELFSRIFRLDASKNPEVYHWSIACGRANGFSHRRERTESVEQDGMTTWKGRYPLSGIAYPSTRTDRMAVNFALNDVGNEHVRLENVQWVRRTNQEEIEGIDFANSVDSSGKIEWQGRKANFQLRPGESGKITKTGQRTYRFETSDGAVPWFV